MDHIIARCGELREQLEKQAREIQRFKQEAASAKSQIALAEEEHRKEVNTLMYRLRASEKEKELLEGDLIASQVHEEALGRKAKTLGEELEREKKEVTRKWELIEEQAYRMILLQETCKSNAPLVKIALEVRARYLEQAAAADTSTPTKKIFNQDIIKAGNKAAHRANGEADRLLFRDGFLTPNGHMKLAKVYQDLYHCSYAEYGCMPKRMHELIDCEATIRTVMVLNKSNRPLKQRQLALDNCDIIRSRYEKLTREDFEKDEDVERRLGRVMELTDEIVEADRVQRSASDTMKKSFLH